MDCFMQTWEVKNITEVDSLSRSLLMQVVFNAYALEWLMTQKIYKDFKTIFLKQRHKRLEFFNFLIFYLITSTNISIIQYVLTKS